jgi:hypothetical protein
MRVDLQGSSSEGARVVITSWSWCRGTIWSIIDDCAPRFEGSSAGIYLCTCGSILSETQKHIPLIRQIKLHYQVSLWIGSKIVGIHYPVATLRNGNKIVGISYRDY